MAGFLCNPFRRAAEHAGVLNGHSLVCQESVNGVAGVLRFDEGLALAIIDPAFIAQLALLVEDKDVRRSLRTVRSRNGLRVAIVEIRKLEVAVRAAYFHFVQTVANLG